MHQWTIGDVTITRIVEQTLEGTLDRLIPAATPERVLQHDWLAPDHVLCPSVRLVPTPGHTDGHVSVLIESRDARALITGDAIHHSCQLVDPAWATPVDADETLAIQSRRKMLDAAVGDGKLLIGSHWAGSSSGHVERHLAGYRLTAAPPHPTRAAG